MLYIIAGLDCALLKSSRCDLLQLAEKKKSQLIPSLVISSIKCPASLLCLRSHDTQASLSI